MQKQKLIPGLSLAWAMLIGANAMFKIYGQYEEALKAKEMDKALDILADLHGHTAGFKAVTSWILAEYGETVKQACGGFGYLEMSGISEMAKAAGFGLVTAEGDNTVMVQ